jgi:hypothetical protein
MASSSTRESEMTFDQALKRIGVTLVKTTHKPNQIILMLRVDPKKASLWNDTLTEFLLASDERGQQGKLKVGWSTDVSKYFYPVREAGVVRYLWRVVLGGNPRAAAEALGRASQRAVAAGVEVKSQPLVGRKEYEHNPAEGKIAGAYGTNDGARVLANAVGGGQ